MDIYVGRSYIVTSMSFQEQYTEIAFFDKDKQGDDVALVEQMLVSNENPRVAEAVKVILEEAEDIIMEGFVTLRNPPETLDPRERLKRGMKAREGDDAADDEEGYDE